MLAHLLAIAIGLGSFALYMAAFFFPEVHRKHDLIWSGVGLFYALVLWVCAGQVRGGLLLGQGASVALLGWLGWQTLSLRRATTPSDQKTTLPDQPLPDIAKAQAQQLQARLPLSLEGITWPAGLTRLPEQLGQWFTQVRGMLKRRPKPKKEVWIRPPAQESDLSDAGVASPGGAEVAAEMAVPAGGDRPSDLDSEWDEFDELDELENFDAASETTADWVDQPDITEAIPGPNANGAADLEADEAAAAAESPESNTTADPIPTAADLDADRAAAAADDGAPAVIPEPGTDATTDVEIDLAVDIDAAPPAPTPEPEASADAQPEPEDSNWSEDDSHEETWHDGTEAAGEEER